MLSDESRNRWGKTQQVPRQPPSDLFLLLGVRLELCAQRVHLLRQPLDHVRRVVRRQLLEVLKRELGGLSGRLGRRPAGLREHLVDVRNHRLHDGLVEALVLLLKRLDEDVRELNVCFPGGLDSVRRQLTPAVRVSPASSLAPSVAAWGPVGGIRGSTYRAGCFILYLL